MLFSILIANYNNGKFFKDCYESILAQTYENWEAIIVDDASTDDSVTIIKKIIKEDARFKLFENDENMGCGFTKRRCVELANGAICGFLDPDDALFPDSLELMHKEHILKPNASLIYSKEKVMDSNLQHQITPNIQNKQVRNNDRMFLDEEQDFLHFSSFKKSFYNKTEGISVYLKRAVDKDLYYKLYEVGEAIFLDQVLYKYRVHKGGISSFQNIEKAKFWHWVVLMELGKRRNINLEDKFCSEFVSREKCFALKSEIKKNPFVIGERIFNSLLKKIKK